MAPLKGYPMDSVPNFVGENATVDIELLKQVKQGLVIRTLVSTPIKGKPQQREVYSEEMALLSAKKLDDAYFKIPDGYEEVNADEYAKAQRIL